MGGPDNATAFAENTALFRSYDVDPALGSPENRAQLLRTQREINALYNASMQLCLKNDGEFPRYMGTADVVRDIELMANVLEGNNSLMYV